MTKRLVSAIVKKRRKPKTKQYKLSAPMKALVDKRIAGHIEDKQAVYHFRRTQFNNSISQVGDLLRVMPEINQTTTREDRVGSNLTMKSLYVKGFIFVDPNDSNQSTDRTAILVRLMCLSSKGEKTATSVFANTQGIVSNLLRAGSVSHSYTGEIEQHLLPTNTAYNTKHYDKTFTIKRDLPLIVTNGGVGITAGVVPFSFKVPCKNKVLRYAQPLDTDSDNFYPFLCMGFTYANGAAASQASVPWLTYSTFATYEDA